MADDNAGRLFACLEKQGLMDNTPKIYTGDQGFMPGENDYIDKRWMHMAQWHANPAHFGIRTKEYRLIFFYGVYYKDQGVEANFEGWAKRYTFRTPPGWEFYDLKKDPLEMDNSYGDPAYDSVVADLKSQLKELRTEPGEIHSQYSEIHRIIDHNWNN